MNNRIPIKVIGLLVALVLSPVANAIWVQGEAKLTLNGADLENVRVQVIKNAIADASFRSGSSISAKDVIIDGLLLSSRAEIRTSSTIQRVEILSETLVDDVLHVVVNVNLTPLSNCPPSKFKARLLLTHFQLLDTRQAAYGSIYDIGAHVTQRFAQQLRGAAPAAYVKQTNVSMTSRQMWANEELEVKEIASNADFLLQEYGQQFAIFGYIKDISLFEQVNTQSHLFESEQVSLRRNFTLKVFVLDTFRQAIIFNESYHSEADWPFDSHYAVDTNNSIFWRSDFGRMVLNTVNAAVTDVSSAVACEPVFTRVISTERSQFTIDIGAAQGVGVNDTFHLLKRPPVSVSSSSRMMIPSESFQYRVTLVNDNMAVVKPNASTPSVSLQLYDVLSPVKFEQRMTNKNSMLPADSPIH